MGWFERQIHAYVARVNERLPEHLKDKPGEGWSKDWCRFRSRQRCKFPRDLDVEATEREGYPIWIPFDRGFCPRHKWDDPATGNGQKQCPVAEPGPNSGDPNALPDATVPYDQGGQRAYRRA